MTDVVKTLSFDDIWDEEIAKIPGGAGEEAQKTTGKRKLSGEEGTHAGVAPAKKATRTKRVSTTAVLSEEVQRMQNENETSESAALDRQAIAAEIRSAEERAARLLEKLDAVLKTGGEAVEATAKYSQLQAQLERHRSKSVVIDRVCAIFKNFLQVMAACRNSCARLPAEFAQMLIRQEAYIRASASALVPQGMSVLVDRRRAEKQAAKDSETQNQLALVPTASDSGSTAVVTYGGPRNKATFKLVASEQTRSDINALQNSYLGTSMLNASYDARTTVQATTQARREAQRRAAQLKAGAEIMPALFGTLQLKQAANEQRKLLQSQVPGPTLAATTMERLMLPAPQ